MTKKTEHGHWPEAYEAPEVVTVDTAFQQALGVTQCSNGIGASGGSASCSNGANALGNPGEPNACANGGNASIGPGGGNSPCGKGLSACAKG